MKVSKGANYDERKASLKKCKGVRCLDLANVANMSKPSKYLLPIAGLACNYFGRSAVRKMKGLFL